MHALLAQNTQELSPWLLVAAAGAVVLIVLLLASPLLRRRSEPSPARTQALAQSTTPAVSVKASPAGASGEHRALERDIQILIKELSDLTRRVNAQIAQVDEKSAKLEQLVRAADERANRLRSLQATANGDGNGSVSGSASAGSSSALLPVQPLATSAADEVIDPRHVEIYTLCEQGLSTQQIADRLQRPSGEVELIIALRPRSSRAVGSSRE